MCNELQNNIASGNCCGYADQKSHKLEGGDLVKIS